MKTATALDVILVRDPGDYGFFGHYIYTGIPDNDPTKLPKGIMYDGKAYGLSSHNTDTGSAAYASGIQIGTPA